MKLRGDTLVFPKGTRETWMEIIARDARDRYGKIFEQAQVATVAGRTTTDVVDGAKPVEEIN